MESNLSIMDELDEFQMLSLQVNDIKSSLDEQFEKNEITEAEYNKNIVKLSYEYAINGYHQDCLLMLMNSTEDYFKRYAEQDFMADEAYFQKATLVFEILSLVGYTPFDLSCTQKEAQA